MLNKLSAFIRQYDMISPGDTVICALSGGADSVALLFALYLLRDKLKIELQAAHFNHRLRGEESQRDEAFVRQLCRHYDIVLHVGSGEVVAGKKGLEAAARDARYAFLKKLPGKIATAHTADDNAETVLMHLVRGTGLKGLGGITPVNGTVIRPMLSVTREDVLAFLQEYSLSWVEDSTNAGNDFMRNRLRHDIMPLFRRENPSVAQKLSFTALQLRQDEQCLQNLLPKKLPKVSELRQMDGALRRRCLNRFLRENGMTEAGKEHLLLVESILYSDHPSAMVRLPGGLVVRRCYEQLTVGEALPDRENRVLEVPCSVEFPELGVRFHCRYADRIVDQKHQFCISPRGALILRSRKAGDKLCLNGGSKTLKKLFIDHKIPAHLRNRIPVLADDDGIVGVLYFGADRHRIATEIPCVEISFEAIGNDMQTVKE